MGLGKVFARTLAARKQNVVLVARSKDKLEALARELSNAFGIRAEPIASDLAEAGAGKRLLDQLRARDVVVDLLVNNAGFGVQGRFHESDLERQLEMIRLHNATVVELTYLLLPALIEARRGGIINISSMAGFQPIPYATLYSATKSFLTTFSLALEQEVRRYGIRVVTVCPGRLRPNPDENPDEERKKVPGGEQDPEAIVAQSLKLLESGGGLLVPGLINKVGNFVERFFPRRLVAKGIAKMNKPK